MNWNTLTKAILMGTDQTVVPEALRSETAWQEAPEDATEAQRLLRVLAYQRQMVRVAREFPAVSEVQLQEPPQIADGEVRPVVAPHRLFERLFYGAFQEVIPEALRWLGHYGVHMPTEFLPEALHWADQHPGHLTDLEAVLLPRARWLIDQHPQWREAVGTPRADQWLHGNPDQRYRYLRHLHDHDPEEALATLRQSWKGERSEDKGRFLTILSQNPKSADIPFLEECLQSGSDTIRQLAGRGLSRLPDHEYRHRVFAEANKCLTKVDGEGYRIDLPAQPDAAWEALGIYQARSGKRWTRSAKQQVANHLWSLVPPTFWEATLSLDTNGLLRFANRSELIGAEALAEAALLHRDINYLLTLLEGWIYAGAGDMDTRLSDFHRKKIVHALPVKELDKLLVEAMAYVPGGSRGLRQKITACLVDRPFSWSAALTVEYIQVFINPVFAGSFDILDLRSIGEDLERVCLHGHPEQYPNLRATLFRAQSGYKEWDQQVDQWLKQLHFRKEMIGYIEKEYRTPIKCDDR
jgi:hypothetical protein